MLKAENDLDISSMLKNQIEGKEDQLGVYKPGFQFQEKAMEFFRQCVGDEVYERAMSSEVGKQYHYVVARAFLKQDDWERFVWIEEHGSLSGFPK